MEAEVERLDVILVGIGVSVAVPAFPSSSITRLWVIGFVLYALETASCLIQTDSLCQFGRSRSTEAGALRGAAAQAAARQGWGGPASRRALAPGRCVSRAACRRCL